MGKKKDDDTMLNLKNLQDLRENSTTKEERESWNKAIEDHFFKNPPKKTRKERRKRRKELKQIEKGEDI